MITKRKKLLFVFPAVPYPARENGIGMRYMPILADLSKHHSIDMILFGSCNQEQKKWLQGVCNHLYILNEYTGSMVKFYEKIYVWLKFILPWTGPISYTHYRSNETSKAISEILENHIYDSVIWVSGYAEYLFRIRKIIPRQSRLTVDMVDSIYLHAKRNSTNQFRNILIDRYELWKIKKFEAKLINLSDASIYISDVDANAIPPKLVDTRKRFVIPNGLYTEDFTQENLNSICSPSIGFLGNMSYGPNIKAVLWLYSNIFSQLRERIPELSFYIIGREPSESIIDLSSDENVHVTGTVDSIWPYVNSIDVFVIPLSEGAGLKNKVLDIMSAGKPIVTSVVGNEGINATNTKEIMLCTDLDDYIDAITSLISQPELRETIGSNAKKFVNTRFSWPSIIRDYNNIIIGEEL